MGRHIVAIVVTALFLASGTACAQQNTRPIELHVDATDAPRKILHARLRIPAEPGKSMTLLYPKWIPGEHGPTGPIVNLVDVKISANGKAVPWQRDPQEMYAILLQTPADAEALDVSLDFLNAGGAGDYSSSSSATATLVDVNWNQVLLYPQGPAARDLSYAATIRLPAGWKFGTALPVAKESTDQGIEFATASLETLVDSPLIAGQHFRTIDLGPGSTVPHLLHIVSDSDEALGMKADDEPRFSQLAREAEALFGAHHYRGYHFLLTLSDHVGHFGLEHHESSDDRLDENFLTDETSRRLGADLLPHEMVHSWNGKYRRPAGLATPDYQTPMKTELLWVYEGLTQYLGMVLATRSGLLTAEDFRQNVGWNAAYLDNRPGREWRSLADTTIAAQVLYRSPRVGRARRRGVDFYDEGVLIWLDADVLIRQKTSGAKSLDDFCRKFFGPPDSEPKVVPYTLDDVVNALNEVCPSDWREFFQSRVYSVNPHAPMGGIENGGWKLSYIDSPTDLQNADQNFFKHTDLNYSLGISVNNKEETVVDVIPGSPADKAGIAPGAKIVAVNGRRFTPELLRGAIKAAKGASAPIELLVESDDFFKTAKLDYHNGEKYPRLDRDPAKQDLLSEITKPRASGNPTTQN